MSLIQPPSIKFFDKTFKPIPKEVNSLEIINQNNIAEEANKIYGEWNERSKQDGEPFENLISGKYDKDLKKLGERFSYNNELRKAYIDKVRTEIDNELTTKNIGADKRNALNCAKSILSKPSIPDYPIPSNVNFKGKYVDIAKDNASSGNDLSRLKTEDEQDNFLIRLIDSEWSSETDFDNNVVNALKESEIKRKRTLNLIKNKTNSNVDSKLEVQDSDLKDLYKITKKHKSLNNNNNIKIINDKIACCSKSLRTFQILLCAATITALDKDTSGIPLPYMVAFLAGGAIGGALDYYRDMTKANQKGLQEDLNELKAHLLNIKLKKLMIKGKVSVREISDIIYS